MLSRRTFSASRLSRDSGRPIFQRIDEFIVRRTDNRTTASPSNVEQPPKRQDSAAVLRLDMSTTPPADDQVVDIERDADLPSDAATQRERESETLVAKLTRFGHALAVAFVATTALLFIVWLLTDPAQLKQMWDGFVGFWNWS